MPDRDPTAELAELAREVRHLLDAWSTVGVREPPSGELPMQDPLPVPEAGPGPVPQVLPPVRPPVQPVSGHPEPAPAPRPAASGEARPSAWAGLTRRVPPEEELPRIRNVLGECTRCGLSRGRKNIVFGTGNPSAAVVVVGEAPGRDEDATGEPFVGAAGQMLDRMVENVLKLRRQDVYIMNVLKCRPPDNRDPMPEEVAACRPFFDAQIAAIRPRVILSLGRVATQVLLDTTQGIRSLRGQWQVYRGIPVMPTYHPAYLLRTPEDKKITLKDLLALKERLDLISKEPPATR